MNQSYENSVRAQRLLEQMTLREKTGQLNQHLYGFLMYQVQNGEILLAEEFQREVIKYGGLGTLYGLFRADPWCKVDFETGLSGGLAKAAYNKMQKFVLEHSRLKIPMLTSSECPHGHLALDGYLLPVNLAAGAAFHPGLYQKAVSVCARQLKAMGVDLALISMLDVLRDPRWGRSEECYSEDPYLTSRMAEAAVHAMQSQGVGVIAKHLCAQGETTGGVNGSAARIGERELREIHLPVVEAVSKAQAAGVMAAYNEVDGIFCNASEKLLGQILREEFGFQGVVMADGLALDQLDVMTGDNEKSAAAALKAGVDISLWDEAYTKLEQVLEKGYISIEMIDRAVWRVLKLKLDLGIFDAPYLDEAGNRISEWSDSSERTDSSERADSSKSSLQPFDYAAYPQSEALARESVVLLENHGILPLQSVAGKIAVIGPGADDIYRQLGDYSPPVRNHREITILRGMCEVFGSQKIKYSNGRDISQAVKAAMESDVIVLVLGGSSSRYEGAAFDSNGAVLSGSAVELDCGEGLDSSSLSLPGNQSLLFGALRSLSKPVITVIVAGRPYAIPKISSQSDALLYSFYPGPMGGKAIAEILSGKYSPTGRLPVSIPRSPGQLPCYYNYKNSYRALHYCDSQDGPLYSFGEGSGYSEFAYEDFTLNQAQAGEYELQLTIENTGAMEDASVIQCYRQVIEADAVPRVRELKAFHKQFLAPGEKKSVRIALGSQFFDTLDQKLQTVQKNCLLIVMDRGKELFRTAVDAVK